MLCFYSPASPAATLYPCVPGVFLRHRAEAVVLRYYKDVPQVFLRGMIL